MTSLARWYSSMALRVSSTSLALSSARRILLSCCRSGMDFCFRQREVESGAFVQFRFGPGAAAVARHDAANVGKANAGALEVAGFVQALEHAEKFVRVSHVKADA